jgi:4a-hydroxytetrahydrobiopterin dehydratase
VPPLLTQEEIDDRLSRLAGWTQEGRHIAREFAFPSFTAAMAFVNRVAEAAEEIDHHPDITISYTRVKLSVTTQSEGGLTRRDFRLAGRIDGLEGQSQPLPG